MAEFDPNLIKLGENSLLVGKANAPEIFADGMSQMLMGTPVSRVIFHTTLESYSERAPEVRRAAAILVMPTGQLVEFALNILHAVKENEQRFLAGNAELERKWGELVKNLDVDLVKES